MTGVAATATRRVRITGDGPVLVPRVDGRTVHFVRPADAASADQEVGRRRVVQSGVTEPVLAAATLRAVAQLHADDELSADIVAANWTSLLEPAMTITVGLAARGPTAGRDTMAVFRHRVALVGDSALAIGGNLPAGIAPHLVVTGDGDAAARLGQWLRDGAATELGDAGRELLALRDRLGATRSESAAVLGLFEPQLRVVAQVLDLNGVEFAEPMSERGRRGRWHVQVDAEHALQIARHFPDVPLVTDTRGRAGKSRRADSAQWTTAAFLKMLRDNPALADDPAAREALRSHIVGANERYLWTWAARYAAERGVTGDEALAMLRRLADDAAVRAAEEAIAAGGLRQGSFKSDMNAIFNGLLERNAGAIEAAVRASSTSPTTPSSARPAPPRTATNARPGACGPRK